jgi:hypothetical protein
LWSYLGRALEKATSERGFNLNNALVIAEEVFHHPHMIEVDALNR